MCKWFNVTMRICTMHLCWRFAALWLLLNPKAALFIVAREWSSWISLKLMLKATSCQPPSSRASPRTPESCRRRSSARSPASAHSTPKTKPCLKAMGYVTVWEQPYGPGMWARCIAWLRSYRQGWCGPTAGWSGIWICPLEGWRTRVWDEREARIHITSSQRSRVLPSSIRQRHGNIRQLLHHRINQISNTSSWFLGWKTCL